jgi:hypothetical protein
MLATVMVELTQGALRGKKFGAQGAAIEWFGTFRTRCHWHDPVT